MEMSDGYSHNHEDFSVATSLICLECNEPQEACMMCSKILHVCKNKKDLRILPGYRVIEEFPDYMVNSQATVRHIQSQRYCMLVRVSKQGGAMINLQKAGKKYTRAAQDLRDRAFNVPSD